MSKNIFSPHIILVFGLLFLSGCAANMAAHPKYMAGSYMLKQNNYEAAIDYFLAELSHNPDNWRAREKLGIAYYKIGQYDKAIPELDRVLTDIPKKPRASYYLGLALLKTGERSRAIEIF